MSTSQLIAVIYAAILHVAALIGLVVLVSLGKITWVEAGPLIAALLGLGAGIPLSLPGVKTDDPAPAPVVVTPAPMAAVVADAQPAT